MIDEVVRKIYEEDARVRQKEMEKKQEQREYIEEFQRQQAHWNAVRSRIFSKMIGGFIAFDPKDDLMTIFLAREATTGSRSREYQEVC